MEEMRMMFSSCFMMNMQHLVRMTISSVLLAMVVHIVFLDGNVFYAQVAYNKNMHTVTLVKGHDWEFNGTAATKSVHERYFNETKQWVGSNFFVQ